MPLDERAIKQVLEQVERRLRRVQHGKVEVNVSDRRFSVKTYHQEIEEGGKGDL